MDVLTISPLADSREGCINLVHLIVVTRILKILVDDDTVRFDRDRNNESGERVADDDRDRSNESGRLAPVVNTFPMIIRNAFTRFIISII